MFDSICCFKNTNNNKKKRVLWEVTTKCNLKCHFCHIKGKRETGPSYKEIEKILKILKSFNIR